MLKREQAAGRSGQKEALAEQGPRQHARGAQRGLSEPRLTLTSLNRCRASPMLPLGPASACDFCRFAGPPSSLPPSSSSSLSSARSSSCWYSESVHRGEALQA